MELLSRCVLRLSARPPLIFIFLPSLPVPLHPHVHYHCKVVRSSDSSLHTFALFSTVVRHEYCPSLLRTAAVDAGTVGGRCSILHTVAATPPL